MKRFEIFVYGDYADEEELFNKGFINEGRSD